MQSKQLDAFFDLAMQYYVAGRHAVFVGLNPVAANILHHALEMFFKAYLSKKLTLEELRKLRHDLPKIWRQVKKAANDPALNQFNKVVRELHKYEELRYPDSVLASGMISTFDILRSTAYPSSTKQGRSEPAYSLCLEDIDEIVTRLFVLASRNPAAYASMLSPAGREDLFKENRHFRRS